MCGELRYGQPSALPYSVHYSMTLQPRARAANTLQLSTTLGFNIDCSTPYVDNTYAERDRLLVPCAAARRESCYLHSIWY